MFANFWTWMDEQVDAGIVIAPEEVLIQLDAKGGVRSRELPKAARGGSGLQSMSRKGDCWDSETVSVCCSAAAFQSSGSRGCPSRSDELDRLSDLGADSM